MAIVAAEIPKANTLKFYELEKVIDPRYNSTPLGDDAYIVQINGFSVKQFFAQPWQFNDRIQFQYHCNQNFGSKIELINEFGTVLYTWTSAANAAFYTIAGNTAQLSTNVTVQMITGHYKLSYSDVPGLAAGTYWMKLTINVDTDGDSNADSELVYLSEPHIVAQVHRNTACIEFKHRANKYDLIFTQTNACFSVRIPGLVGEFDPVATDTSYKDQTEKVKLLSSYPSEQFSVFIGGRTGIPDYLYNIINRLFSCSSVKIDGEGYVKDEGSKWETSRSSRFPLVWASMKLRQSNPVDSYTTVKKFPLFLWNNNGGQYPYFLHTITISDGTTTKTVSSAKVIENAVEEQNYLNTLNGSIATSNGLSGSFYTEVSGVNVAFYYQPGATEYYSSAPSQLVNRYYFNISKENGLTVLVPNSIILTITGSYCGVSWGSTNANKYGTAVPGNLTATHSYASLGANGTFTNIRIFHSGNITSIQSASPRIAGISVSAGSNSTLFGLISIGLNSNRMTALNMATFAGCLSTLVGVAFTDTLLAAVTNMNLNFLLLTSVEFTNSKLSTAQVNAILDGILGYTITNGLSNGIIHLEGQTPAAPPSGQGIADKTTLINAPYTYQVFTD